MEGTVLVTGVAVLASPLATSLSLSLWARLWRSGQPSVIGRFRTLATATGVLGLVAAVAAPPRMGLVVLAGIYIGFAVGAGALLATGRRGDCGCWGSAGGDLSARLVAFDGTLAVACGLLWSATATDVGRPGSEAVVVAILLATVGMLAVLAVSGREAVLAHRTSAVEVARYLRSKPLAHGGAS